MDVLELWVGKLFVRTGAVDALVFVDRTCAGDSFVEHKYGRRFGGGIGRLLLNKLSWFQNRVVLNNQRPTLIYILT